MKFRSRKKTFIIVCLMATSCIWIWNYTNIKTPASTNSDLKTIKIISSIRNTSQLKTEPSFDIKINKSDTNSFDTLIYGEYSETVERKLEENRNYKCPLQLATPVDIKHLHICGEIADLNYKLIMFTTMYHTPTHNIFFENTLRVLASLTHKHHIRPVLFTENPGAFVKANRTHLLQYACALGWTVLLVPHCNKDVFPVFKSMFNVTMTTWSNTWHSYSNADMLFDDSYLSTIEFVDSLSRFSEIVMMLGRRYQIAVKINFCSIEEYLRYI